jgi:PAS domain-containing protein
VHEPGYLVLDGRGLVTSANVTARRILRTPHEQLVGHRLAELGCPVLSRDGSALDPNRHPGEVTCRTGLAIDDAVFGYRRPDETYVWVSIATRALQSEGRHLNTVMFVDEVQADLEEQPLEGLPAAT